MAGHILRLVGDLGAADVDSATEQPAAKPNPIWQQRRLDDERLAFLVRLASKLQKDSLEAATEALLGIFKAQCDRGFEEYTTRRRERCREAAKKGWAKRRDTRSKAKPTATSPSKPRSKVSPEKG